MFRARSRVGGLNPSRQSWSGITSVSSLRSVPSCQRTLWVTSSARKTRLSVLTKSEVFSKRSYNKSSKKNDSGPIKLGTGKLVGLALGGVALAAVMGYRYLSNDVDEITFQDFKTKFLEDQQAKIAKLEVVNGKYVNVYLVKPMGAASVPDYYFTIGSNEVFERQLKESQEMLGVELEDFIHVVYKETLDTSLLVNVVPTLLFFGAMIWLFTRSAKKSGGLPSIFGVNSKAKKYDKTGSGTRVTFDDVAGLDEAKNEIMEFVSFLKNPGQFTALGAKIPKGALLVGPPGTGKTLLAKAAAGEASVPFFSISGSDFIEMFVGVGPARVRELFQEARESAPCIVFIDEIDAVGKARGREGARNDERDNTLNQLLVEMDGFNTTAGVVVLAGTNRPEILDKALLRPGRFDRQIALDSPDMKSREAIFKVHLKPLKLAISIEEEAKKLANMTPGFSGADIANVCNEAALIAARNSKEAIDANDFEQAIDRIIGGLEKKNMVLAPEEKKTVAYHEAGHAVTSWFLPHCDPLLKLSIVPRGRALGYAQYVPRDQYLRDTDELFDMMCMALGGRVAELLTFGKLSTGAQDDLDKVTQNAYAQIMIYGMNPVLGPISYSEQSDGSIDKPFSEQTSELIDIEARNLVNRALERTTQLLKEKSKELGIIAEMLLAKEKLRMEDLETVLGARPPKRFIDEIKDLLPDEWKDETGAVKDQKAIDSERRKAQLEKEGLPTTDDAAAPTGSSRSAEEVEPENVDPNDPAIPWGFFPRSRKDPSKHL